MSNCKLSLVELSLFSRFAVKYGESCPTSGWRRTRKILSRSVAQLSNMCCIAIHMAWEHSSGIENTCFRAFLRKSLFKWAFARFSCCPLTVLLSWVAHCFVNVRLCSIPVNYLTCPKLLITREVIQKLINFRGCEGSVHEDVHGNAPECWGFLCQTHHRVPAKTPMRVLTTYLTVLTKMQPKVCSVSFHMFTEKGERDWVRKHVLSKKALLCFKNVWKEKHPLRSGQNLLRTHFLSEKVSKPSSFYAHPLCASQHILFARVLFLAQKSWIIFKGCWLSRLDQKVRNGKAAYTLVRKDYVHIFCFLN